jgi:hypothetical protein
MLAATDTICVMQIAAAVAVVVCSVITVVYCTADGFRRKICLANYWTVCV